MTVNFELEVAENWQIRDSQYFTATAGAFLPEYTPVLEFTSNVLAVFVDNAEALETWYSAGWINQIINLPFGPSLGSSVNNKRLRLRQKQLLIFPRLTTTYKVSVRFPRWFTQATFTLWEYVGPQSDTVEQKLDTLLQQHLP